MRHFAVVLVAVLAGAVAPLATAGGPGLSESGRARFPDRSYVLRLTAPGAVTPDRVEVTENGRRVSNVSIVPAREAGVKSFGVVLVVDASNSMRGAPIEGAVEAARTFVARTNPNQPLGLVTFNRTSRVVVPLTTDHAAIERALASTPPLARATHAFDAVDTAVSLLESAGVSPGSVVLLSDGADTGSTVTADEVGLHARSAHVRIFAVGLRSRALRPSALRTLAGAADGEYIEAPTAASLGRIYDALGSELASEYLLRYRSLEGPAADVDVAVRIRGVPGVAHASYTTPNLPVAAAKPYRRPLADRFWLSPIAMVVVACSSAFLVALGLVALLRRRRPTLRGRMAEFVTLTPLVDEAENHTAERERPPTLAVDQTRWWARFVEDLDVGRVSISAGHILAGAVLGTVLAAWLLSLVSPLASVLALAVPLAVRSWVASRAQAQRAKFGEQLPDNLQVVASAMRAGHSLAGALSVVVEDAPDPSGTEFKRVVADERLGIPLENSLTAVARRMQSPDLEQVALVASLQRETGGNTAEVLDRVTDGIRERFALRRMVKTLTAQGRMSRWVLTALPVFLLILISVINPRYMAPFFASSGGRAFLVLAAILVTAGSLVIRKIVDIKV